MSKKLQPLRVLMLEDRANDAELNLHELEKAGFAPQWERVENEKDFVARLSPSLDVILADFQLPQFDGLSAIALVRKMVPQVPIVIISGSLGDEKAASCIKAGAADYVLKDRLARLGTAVTQAMEAARLRSDGQKSHERLQESERFVRSTLNGLTAHIAILDERGVIVMVNEPWRKFTRENGLSLERGDEGVNYLELSDHATGAGAQDAHGVAAGIRSVLHGDCTLYEAEYPCHGPTETRWFLVRVTPFPGDGSRHVVVAHEDITARRRQEQALRESEARHRTTLDSIMEGCQLVRFDWTYLYLNDVAAVHNRRPNAEVLGRKMTEVWPGIEATPVFALLKRSMEERVAIHEEVEFTFPDGYHGWFDMRSQPVPEGIFLLSIDVSERRKSDDKIAHQIEELQRWHDVTLGREDRVADLKAEVNQLLARLNQPPRYRCHDAA